MRKNYIVQGDLQNFGVQVRGGLKRGGNADPRLSMYRRMEKELAQFKFKDKVFFESP